MKKLLLSLLLTPTLFACPGPTTTDAGTDAGEEPPIEFDVAGTAAMFPDSLTLLADAGASSEVTGLTLRVEEPLKVATNDPLGVFSTQVLDATGAFTATKVPSELVSLGVAAGIFDEVDGGTPRVIRSATVMYDVALEGKKPSANLTNGKAWAVPTQLHEALNAAVGEANIRALTGTNDFPTLIQAGFILGKVVDAQGNPVAGVAVEPSVAGKTSRLFYPSADLTSSTVGNTGGVTSSNGLFVYVHNGGTVDTFRFTITGHSEYKTRNAGANADACLVTTVYPGTTPPP